jgi:hypothetical protein
MALQSINAGDNSEIWNSRQRAVRQLLQYVGQPNIRPVIDADILWKRGRYSGGLSPDWIKVKNPASPGGPPRQGRILR